MIFDWHSPFDVEASGESFIFSLLIIPSLVFTAPDLVHYMNELALFAYRYVFIHNVFFFFFQGTIFAYTNVGTDLKSVKRVKREGSSPHKEGIRSSSSRLRFQIMYSTIAVHNFSKSDADEETSITSLGQLRGSMLAILCFFSEYRN